jgi:hypothetical protein
VLLGKQANTIFSDGRALIFQLLLTVSERRQSSYRAQERVA